MTALTVALAVVGTTFVALPIYSLGVRRLLGLRLGLLRTLIAGAIALLVVSPIISELSGSTYAGQGVLPGFWFVILGVAIALLVGMAFLVVAEVFVPSGSLPGALFVARGLRKRLVRTRRYAQMGRILVRRGLLPYMRGGRRAELRTSDGRARLAQSLRMALEEAV
jgi:ubiquinone biosynthesis protein